MNIEWLWAAYALFLMWLFSVTYRKQTNVKKASIIAIILAVLGWASLRTLIFRNMGYVPLEVLAVYGFIPLAIWGGALVVKIRDSR